MHGPKVVQAAQEMPVAQTEDIAKPCMIPLFAQIIQSGFTRMLKLSRVIAEVT